MQRRTAIPKHGNYHGYYTKRPGVQDERLALLPSDFFIGKRVLDVGCNDGKVTCEIAQTKGAAYVLGVDIDDVLVDMAWKRRRSAWSTQCPRISEGDSESNIEQPPPRSDSKKRKRSAKDEVENADPDADTAQHPKTPSSSTLTTDRRFTTATVGYFPASCEHEFGPLPIPSGVQVRGGDASTKFPHNLSFRSADWVGNAIPEDQLGYDIVLGLSITKWIHLNSGDTGLETFFKRVYQVIHPGGIFILEPQAWETYAKAKRMDPALKETAKTLHLQPSDFPRVLREIGFSRPKAFGSTGIGGFARPVDVYVKE